jgi:aminodeoxyfutalosine synthase
MEGMTAFTAEDAEALLGERDLLSVGVKGDEERRRRHGTRTTFVRVFEVHGDAVPSSLPARASAGEIRLVGKPASIEHAVAAVRAARALAESAAVPLTAYSLTDLYDATFGSRDGFRALLGALRDAGLDTIAEAPVDLSDDIVALVVDAREQGLLVPRLTVHGTPEGPLSAGDRIAHVLRAQDIQRAAGGVRAFAPLPRVSSIAQPSTGYDDVKVIAMARLLADDIDSIQVDWPLYGPKLAQVALTVGADDVDGVSPLEGDLGRRRSPIEEIRGNITAAGLEAVERDARFAERRA